MTAKDKRWSEALVKKFKYRGRVVHFVRTTLPLRVGNSNVEGTVYQAVEKLDFFYVVNTDAILTAVEMRAGRHPTPLPSGNEKMDTHS
jgi:hypothetical protein